MGNGNSLLVYELNSRHWGIIYDPKIGTENEKRVSDSRKPTWRDLGLSFGKVEHLANSFEKKAVVKDSQARMTPLLQTPHVLWHLACKWWGVHFIRLLGVKILILKFGLIYNGNCISFKEKWKHWSGVVTASLLFFLNSKLCLFTHTFPLWVFI